MTTLGVDLFNGNSDGYDMSRVHNDLGPNGFLIHKASQGWPGGSGGWVDWKLQGAIQRARAAGIRRVGGYHWLLKGHGAAQADLFASALDLIGGRSKVLGAVDYERNDWNQALNPDYPTLLDFTARCRAIGVNLALTYTAAWYTDGPYPGTMIRDPKAVAPLWWSGYINVGQVGLQQALPGVTPNWIAAFDGFTSYRIRQFSSNVLVAGNPSDVNVSYLSDADLDRMFGSQPGPAPAPVPSTPAGYHQFDGFPVLSLTVPHNRDATTGGKVHVWQNAINALSGRGLLRVDGEFGPATRKATLDFQSAARLTSDAVVGPNTWGAMAKTLTDRHLSVASRVASLAPDHEERAALPENHILHPSFHFSNGELNRRVGAS